jgi:dephospho-CoA kinase
MIKVGLTGGIASGKSLVGRLFTELGAHTIGADELAHELMEPGLPAYNEIVEKFGDSILNDDKTVNRGKLAELAFDKKRPQIYLLNRILHPGVIQKYEKWMDDIEEKEPGAIVMLEAALLLEAGLRRRFNKIIVVTVTQQRRIERWAQRYNLDLETARLEVTRRMMAQAPDEAKLQAADFVIDNSGTVEETRAQVQKVYEALVEEARAKTA